MASQVRRRLRPATTRTRRASLLVGLVALAFGAGFLVREWQIPPQRALSAATGWFRGTAAGRFLAALAYRVHVFQMGEKFAPGAFRPLTPEAESSGLTAEQRATIMRLRTLGYLKASEPASGKVKVTTHVSERAYQGLNLYTSGHAPEAVLMDMEGEVLHRWSHTFEDAFPEVKSFPDDVSGTGYWRRVRLFPDGDLIAMFSGFGLIKVDRDSHLLWARAGGYHHDLFIADSGQIYVLSREVKILPRIHPYRPVLVDSIEVLDPEGRPLRTVSVLEAFERSRYAPFIKRAPPWGDILHTNTIAVLDGAFANRNPAFAQGNVLISVLEMDAIAIVDMQTETVEWAMSGPWRRQHDPRFLENGNILLFDNQGHGGMSKVIEFDPLTQEIAWSYEGTPVNGFYSQYGGFNHRLANGNTLITETDAGRAFEVTPDGQIVWEFYNAAREGENDELVAILCDVTRLGPEFPLDWLDVGHDKG